MMDDEGKIIVFIRVIGADRLQDLCNNGDITDTYNRDIHILYKSMYTVYMGAYNWKTRESSLKILGS